MSEFNKKTLIELANRYLRTRSIPPSFQTIDDRTIHYYEFSEVLDKPKKKGRENVYDAYNVKQVVIVRIMQVGHLSHEDIRKKKKTVSVLLTQYGQPYGITEAELDAFIKAELENIPATKKSAGVELAPQEPKEGQPAKETQMSTTATAKKKREDNGLEEILVAPNDYQKFQEIQKNMNVGTSFVFLKDLDEGLGKRLYRLLYGQKSKKGVVSKAVIPAIDEEFELPGCTVKGPSLRNDLVAIVSDKDVYKEGSDVAQLFVFDPSSPDSTKKVVITIDGAHLDTLEVKLDSNGCGVCRFATLAVGTYEAKVEDSKASRKFEAARYTLAPLTATLSKFNKRDENGKTKFSVAIEALSFGQPFQGPAQIAVMRGVVVDQVEDVNFVEGLAQLTFEPKGDDALALRVYCKEDPDLIANVPLSGSRKEEREDTQVSGLGKIKAISLIQSEDATFERGIYISEKGISNTPIVLHNVVSKKIELGFLADIEELTVIVREPALGVTNVYEIGEGKKGKGHKIEFRSAIAQVSIGAFINGKPWEGHAVVVRPSEATVAIKAPASLKPGEELPIKIVTKSKATVLVRVADKRMRVQDSPMTATASMMKRWIDGAISKTKNGEVTKTVDPYDGFRGGAAPAVMGGGRRYAATAFGLSLEGITRGAERHMMIASSHTDDDRKGLMMSSTAKRMPYPSVKNIVQPDYTLPGGRKTSGEEKTSGGIVLHDHLDDDSEVATAMAPETAVAREMEVDLIYSGLIEVDQSETIKVQLPDCIGSYDISAFLVSKGDWAEAKTDLVVDKECYIEPMIPQFVHEEDEIMARAVGVRGPKIKKYIVKIDDVEQTHSALQEGKNVVVSWGAKPGVNEVTMLDEDDNEIDKIVRLVERPGEETVFAQELRILKAGEEYDISQDSGAMSVKVIPGVQGELKAAVHICTDFSHSCCEQTSAKVMAACVAAMVGETASDKEKGYESIIRGEARLRSMYIAGRGFMAYPGNDINTHWSSAAAHRVSKLDMLLDNKLPADAKKAVESMIAMGKDVMKAHGGKELSNTGVMELIYYGYSAAPITAAEILKVVTGLAGAHVWSYQPKTEAAYCAASLIKANRIEEGINVVNAVSRAMGGTLGGAMHGSCECLSYMHMVHELRKAGIVPGAGSGKVKVNGKDMDIEKAMTISDVSTVKAVKSACAIRIQRLSKIRFDEMNAGVQMTIDVKAKTGAKIRPGSQVKMTVKIDNYQNGDVLCVALPDCLSRIISGAKSKKFQLDFGGRSDGNKTLEIDLVAGRSTNKAQHWAAVVRNMYDGARLGSVGLLTTEVK